MHDKIKQMVDTPCALLATILNNFIKQEQKFIFLNLCVKKKIIAMVTNENLCLKKVPKFFLFVIQDNEMVRSFESPKCLLLSGRKNGRSNIKTVK